MFKNLAAVSLGLSATLSEIIELTLTYGFGGVEVDMADFCERAESDGLERPLQLIASAKIRVSEFRLPIDLDADDEAFDAAVTRLDPILNVAARIGCRRCYTRIAPGSDRLPYHENFEVHRKRLDAVATKLAAHDVRMGIDFDGLAAARERKQFEFVHDFDALQVLVGTVGSPHVGLVLDLWNVHAAGGSFESVRSKLPADHVIDVRLADAPQDVPLEQYTAKSRLVPGKTGIIDCTAALTALAEMGYAGPVTPLPARRQFEGRRRDAMCREISEALDRIWKDAELGPQPQAGVTV